MFGRNNEIVQQNFRVLDGFLVVVQRKDGEKRKAEKKFGSVSNFETQRN